MLSINLYEFVLRNCIDLEEFISGYTKGKPLDEYGYEYIHKCPFCHGNEFHVDVSDGDLGNSKYECYDCNAGTFTKGDIIEFYSTIKQTNKYDATLELFEILKKKNNAYNISDYDFVVNIIKEDDVFDFDNFLQMINCYNEIIDESKKYDTDDELINYLCSNHYGDISLDYFSNPNYIYKLWQEEKQNGETADYTFLDYLSSTLSENKDFLLKLNSDINALPYASNKLRNDFDFILNCINEHSHFSNFYNYIGNNLKNNKDFILNMLKINILLFSKIEDKFKDDKEIVLSIFSKNFDNNNNNNNMYKSYHIMISEPLLQYVSERLKNDDEVITAALDYSWWEFEFVPDKYKKDKTIIEKMLKTDIRSFQYVDTSIKEDDEYIEYLLKTYLISLEYTNKRIKKKYGNNKEFMKKQISSDSETVKYLSDELKNDEEFILSIIKETFFIDLVKICPKLVKDENFILKVLNLDFSYFSYFAENLINDKFFKPDFLLKIITSQKLNVDELNTICCYVDTSTIDEIKDYVIYSTNIKYSKNYHRFYNTNEDEAYEAYMDDMNNYYL